MSVAQSAVDPGTGQVAVFGYDGRGLVLADDDVRELPMPADVAPPTPFACHWLPGGGLVAGFAKDEAGSVWAWGSDLGAARCIVSGRQLIDCFGPAGAAGSRLAKPSESGSCHWLTAACRRRRLRERSTHRLNLPGMAGRPSRPWPGRRTRLPWRWASAAAQC